MSTRDISTQRDFPFVPATFTAAEEVIVHAVVDIFLIIRGSRDGEDVLLTGRDIRLLSWTVGAGTTDLVFRANEGTSIWDFTFTVPNSDTGTQTGKVIATVAGDAYAVLFYNSATIPNTSGVADLSIEPCRAQWMTEQVESISFYNIGRCYDTEFEGEEYLIAAVNAGSPDLDLEDGYNTALTVEDSVILVNTLAGIGKGTADEVQLVPINRDPCAVPPRLNATYVTCINGLQAIDGNVEVLPGGSMASVKATGSITFRDTAT